MKPIEGDYLQASAAMLKRVQGNMDEVYGPCADSRSEINVLNGEGRVADLLDFVAAE